MGYLCLRVPAERRALEAYEEWERDPSTAKPWQEVKAELIRDGLIDRDELAMVSA